MLLENDVLIVGAGLAGLAAAYPLGDLDTLVVERADRIGGRILTRTKEGVAYDLGALFAYHEEMAPFDLGALRPIQELAPIGFSDHGVLRLGETVAGTIAKAGFDVAGFGAGTMTLDEMPPRARALVSAFFGTIHPGKIEAYVPERQRDALVRWPTPHHRERNATLLGAYTERLHASIMPGANVLHIADDGRRVISSVALGGRVETIVSRAVIVTAPAPIARSVIGAMTPASRAFLESVELGGYTVCVLGLREAKLTPFSYVATPDLPMRSVFQQHDGDTTVLIAYFEPTKVAAIADAEIVELTRSSLAELGAGELGPLSFSDVHRWEQAGPIITPQAYQPWSDDKLRPSARVILAGDYTFPEFPYGMRAAARSGARAAQQALDLIRG